MRIVLVSFLSRISAIHIRVLANYLKKNGHFPILIFADALKLPSVKSISALAQYIQSLDPAIVGMSVYTNHAGVAQHLTKELHRIFSVPVIWGGPHATAMPDYCLQFTNYVCVGEGEIPLLNLCKAIDASKSVEKVEGIWTFKNGVKTQSLMPDLYEDLDTLPYPEWEMEHQYSWDGKSLKPVKQSEILETMNFKYDIITGRGCPNNCSYCYNAQLRKLYKGKGRYVRRRSVKHVITELKYALRLFPDIGFVNFWDDCFIYDLKYIQSFCSKYKKQIGLPFYCLARLELLDEETIDILSDAGLTTIQIGIQSSGKKTLNLYDRFLPELHIVKKCIKFLQHVGIHVILDVIFNNPYETIKETEDTVKFFMDLPKPYMINGWNLVMLPGTKLAEKAIKDGLINQNQSGNLTDLLFSNINSPAFFPFEHELPSGPYRCNYSYHQKRVLNILLAMLSSWSVVLIRPMYYLRHFLPIKVLQIIWDKDTFVINGIYRLLNKYAQIEGVSELINLGKHKKAIRIILALMKGRITDQKINKYCYEKMKILTSKLP